MAATPFRAKSRKTGPIWPQSRRSLRRKGFEVESDLAFGEPATQIVGWVEQKGCDLIAMSTHGHRLLGDLLLGTTASRVQHMVDVPVLMLRAKKT